MNVIVFTSSLHFLLLLSNILIPIDFISGFVYVVWPIRLMRTIE
jgi:hypothetical protein